MSAITRARKLLSLIEKRGAASAAGTQRKQQLNKALEEEVVLKGSGRAIAKVLEMGVFFQADQTKGGPYKVRVRTGGVGAVDDVVMDDGGEEGGGKDGEGEEVEESRVRKVPVVEVGVSLK